MYGDEQGDAAAALIARGASLHEAERRTGIARKSLRRWFGSRAVDASSVDSERRPTLAGPIPRPLPR
jgi:hypothetical protein